VESYIISALPDFAVVNMSLASVTPVSDTSVNRPASTFSRLQQWFALGTGMEMHIFNTLKLTLSIYQLYLAIFNLVNIFFTELNWFKLPLAVFEIISAGSCFV